MATHTPVHVQLTTRIDQDGTVETRQFKETGEIVQKGEIVYLRYQEHQADQSVVPVTFKIQTDQLLLTRGPVELRSQLQFQTQQTTVGQYQTPYGNLVMTTQTNDYQVQLDLPNLTGSVAVDYQLFSGDNLLGKYELRLIFNK
ncbi:DUF1934 domain-containing protein [Lapidilactobacillus wuchangensis]|uniref:DUF1934 domain-containing protein n=1 Tax=Lapidilactobacillus wuchangensis TaxID=2486001 RepID=UPI000F78646F|nr:DUF1934 domain-containing protein [Lapidilactobacillus wuchangensis]